MEKLSIRVFTLANVSVGLTRGREGEQLRLSVFYGQDRDENDEEFKNGKE